MSSNFEVDSDGFQIVKSKRNNKNKQTKIPPQVKDFIKTDIDIDVEKAIGRISSAVDDLKQSQYFEDVIKPV
ncbi:hypothetical protein K1T71_001087 [Dendrolimus kikuchii]|uniref:Uncharacterized protein n=1 Tax=Dendrolimus kikuchii TaxID=765133 RepID=A0ACC1DGX5_9NEOP|nr:hypothetical protein K1T71_001087 [Dendrolimus kikuchii]